VRKMLRPATMPIFESAASSHILDPPLGNKVAPQNTQWRASFFILDPTVI
jgi:hypothetical protein